MSMFSGKGLLRARVGGKNREARGEREGWVSRVRALSADSRP